MKHLIGMTSITYAVKAQKILRANGIITKIVPTPKNTGSGCGYSIETDADPYTVTKLMKDNGVKFKAVYR